MTVSRPELTAKKPTRSGWRLSQGSPSPIGRNADPKRRTGSAPLDDSQQSHAERTALLVGARYNSTRPDKLAKAGNISPELFTACEELRNRDLATRLGATPARYVVPEALATAHATTSTPQMPFELSALLHDPKATATYLSRLQTLNPEIGSQIARYIDRTRNELEQNAHTLGDRKKYRLQDYSNHPETKTYWLTAHEQTALNLAWQLQNAQQYHTQTLREQQRKAKREARKQARRTAPNSAPAPESDQMSGWLKLVTAKPDRPLAHLGRFGRRKIATNTGRNPNRLHNYCGDPQRRIFSRVTRGDKALVVVDNSGSMSFDSDDLEAIMKASAGATVVIYSASEMTNDAGELLPNCHLIAHKNRRVRKMPRGQGGNGVDAPALLWAIKNYRTKRAPIIWITDGGVTGDNDCTTPNLRRQCHRICTKYSVIIAHNAEKAQRTLDQIRKGIRPHHNLETLRA